MTGVPQPDAGIRPQTMAVAIVEDQMGIREGLASLIVALGFRGG